MGRILGILLTVALVVGGSMLMTKLKYGNKLKFGAGELYYKSPVTEEEATKIGGFLKEVSIFTDADERSAQLVKDGETYRLRFVIQADKVNDPQLTLMFSVVGLGAGGALGGKKVVVDACDDDMKVLRTFLEDKPAAPEGGAPAPAAPAPSPAPAAPAPTGEAAPPPATAPAPAPAPAASGS